MGQQGNKLLQLIGSSTKQHLALVTAIVVVVLFLGMLLVWLNKDNTIALNDESRVALSPTQIQSMEDIGEWEFLAISDEEIIDTVRHGFFGDDQLVRIYYGTLRLGINMKQAKENWIRMEGDTVIAVLPPVKLLDEDFIDEARTQSFFEEGKWSQQDRKKLYYKAHAAMKRRCLTQKNYETAEQNAKEQFTRLLHSMGFEKVKVEMRNEE